MKKWGIDFSKRATQGVIAFVLLAIFMFSCEDTQASTQMEGAIGTAYFGGHRYNGGVLLITESFYNNKIYAGVGLTTKLNCIGNSCGWGDSPNNQFVQIQRVTNYKKLELGIGISYWHNQTPGWNSNTPFALHLGWNFNKNLGIKWRHYSTAGSSDINQGLDVVTVGWRFK